MTKAISLEIRGPKKGIEGPINRFLQYGLLVECGLEYNTPILPVKKNRWNLPGSPGFKRSE